jgi:hypothetical protein
MNQRKADRKRVIPARRFIDGLLHHSKRLVGEATQPQGAGKEDERADAMIKTEEVRVEGTKLGRERQATLTMELCRGLVAQIVVSTAHPTLRPDGARRVLGSLRDDASLFRNRSDHSKDEWAEYKLRNMVKLQRLRMELVHGRDAAGPQIRGLAVVFGVRLPRALTAAFIDNALRANEGIAGLSAAMRGLIAARTAVMSAVTAIDADIRRMTRASAACRRLMTIPGVGQLTALAFVAAIDDPSRIRRSRDVGAYLGLAPRRYQSGEVDYIGSISKCGDRRVRALLYEAASVMLTRYKGQLKLKDLAFAIAKRSTMRKARIALARRLAIIMHAMLRDGTEFASA